MTAKLLISIGKIQFLVHQVTDLGFCFKAALCCESRISAGVAELTHLNPDTLAVLQRFLTFRLIANLVNLSIAVTNAISYIDLLGQANHVFQLKVALCQTHSL
jgi:hypothetical protein